MAQISGLEKQSIGAREDAVRNKAIQDRIPAGRWGTPEDLMGTIVFLCSDASSYLNGSVVTVDGGWMGR